MASKKPRFGDIIEITTPKGLAYLQYTAKDALYGDLVRILPGLFQTRPSSFEKLVGGKELYFTFYPVTAPILREVLTIVSNEEIPRWAQGIPIMRKAGGRTNQGKVRNWWIVEGDQSFKVDTLTPEQENLSVMGIWTHPLLVHRLVEGWLPKDAGKGRPPGARQRTSRETGNDEPLTQRVEHYLYFSRRDTGEKAAAKIRPMNHKVEVLPADENLWVVLVHQRAEDKSEISATKDALEALAEELKGDYDGFEIGVLPQTEPPTVN